MKYFLDTDIFLRNLDSDNTHFQYAYKILDACRLNVIEAYTSDVVLSEIEWVLRSHYKIGKKDVLEVLKSIKVLNNLKFINNFDRELTLKFYEKYNLKFVDCQLASILGDNFTMLSFDKEFNKIKEINFIEASKFAKTRI